MKACHGVSTVSCMGSCNMNMQRRTIGSHASINVGTGGLGSVDIRAVAIGHITVTERSRATRSSQACAVWLDNSARHNGGQA